ncbi:hypothetical protein FGO68_gene17032 [Halteria grandinella]|uniref:EamA domain-containing protein n=1 Tax=Halteria grandinella TaxID=5974 RepID=A0A8J8NMK7_HALGN|nr:hypothetical protein FGO68_gene17032 [Halteria grandinella]
MKTTSSSSPLDDLKTPLLSPHSSTHSSHALQPPDSLWHNIRGFIFMLSGMLFMTISYLITKQLYLDNSTLSAFEVVASRSVIQVVFNDLLIRYFNRRNTTQENKQAISYSQLNKRQLSLLMVRLCLAYPTWLMVYYSVAILPVGLVQTIQNLIPFITLIISYYALSETLKAMEVANMVLSFLGVLIMIYYSNTQTVGGSITQYTLGICLNIIAAVFLSIINVIIRKLNDVHYSVTAGFQSMGNLAFSIIAMILFRLSYATVPLTFTLKDVLMLTVNGLVQTFAQLMFVRSFQLVKAGRVAGLQFLSIVMGYLGDAIFFGYSIKAFEWAGAGIIIVCSAVMFGMKLFNYSK